MKAVILVGGEGTRMRPLTFKTPKPLLPIANIEFIERQIKWLGKYGVDNVILSLGYLPNEFETFFNSNPIEGIKIEYAIEEEPLGTAGAIKFAIGEASEDILVCNGDVLTDLDVSRLLEFHRTRNSIATIALTYVEDPSAFGVVPTHEDGQVIAFVEKPPAASAPSHWINAGIYILSPKFIDLIPTGINSSIEREVFPRVLETEGMYAMESDAYWLDIGTPAQYLRAHSDYLDNIAKYANSDGLKEVIPGLFSDGEVEIGIDVVVKSNVVVGQGTTIGNSVILSACAIGERCIIESNTELENCVIYSGSKIGESTKVLSSVVGNSCDIGQDVELSDLTIVGTHEKIESNSTFKGERVSSLE